MDELNAGSFAVVQLYHISDAGTPDEPASFVQRWNPPGEYYGPIFDKNGGGTMDWDPLFWVPMYAANLSHFDVPPEDVYSGRVLETIRRWLIPIKFRVTESAKAMGRDLKNRADDISREATNFLWREAQKPDATRPIYAWKHLKDQVKAWEQRQEASADLENYYLHKGM